MTSLFQRDAISRANQFLRMARECRVEERDEYEAFLEAAIVFGRSAVQRVKRLYEKHPNFKTWWNGLDGDVSVEFFRTHRNYILKEGSPKVGQVIRLGTPRTRAGEHYYFETSDVPATETIERHLHRITEMVADAHARFGATKSKTD